MKKAEVLFRQMFFGLSSEQAFLNGLNVDELGKNFHYIYSLLKVLFHFIFLTAILLNGRSEVNAFILSLCAWSKTLRHG